MLSTQVNTIPFYCLKALITAKYGHGRFNYGCKMVAQFVSFQTNRIMTTEEIRQMCEVTDPDLISEHPLIAKALVSLFKLKSADELAMSINEDL